MLNTRLLFGSDEDWLSGLRPDCGRTRRDGARLALCKAWAGARHRAPRRSCGFVLQSATLSSQSGSPPHHHPAYWRASLQTGVVDQIPEPVSADTCLETFAPRRRGATAQLAKILLAPHWGESGQSLQAFALVTRPGVGAAGVIPFTPAAHGGPPGRRKQSWGGGQVEQQIQGQMENGGGGGREGRKWDSEGEGRGTRGGLAERKRIKRRRERGGSGGRGSRREGIKKGGGGRSIDESLRAREPRGRCPLSRRAGVGLRARNFVR